MTHIFFDFFEELCECANASDLRDVMSRRVARYDLGDFAYLVLPRHKREKARLVSTYQSGWTSHYLRQQYEGIDPVIVRAQAYAESFKWGAEGEDLGCLTKRQRQLFDEASIFGVCRGFTIPIHDGTGPIAAMTLATDVRRGAFERSIEAHRDVLTCMAFCFHATARRLARREWVVANARLSPREIECLQWAARGKTAWETGRILGIAQRTVRFHVENAKVKLGVHSITQAIEILANQPEFRVKL